MLGIVTCDEEEDEEASDESGKAKHKWLYSLSREFDHKTLWAIAGWGKLRRGSKG
jgi:hypothetical protein